MTVPITIITGNVGKQLENMHQFRDAAFDSRIFGARAVSLNVDKR